MTRSAPWPTRAVALTVVILAGLDPCASEAVSGPLEPPPEERPFPNGSGFVTDVGDAFTFSLVFVKNYGGTPAILDDVELIEPTRGIELVGTMAASVRDEHNTRGGDEEFPPRQLPGMKPLEGFAVPPVTSPAGRPGVQIALGLRVTEPGEQGFRAVAIRYHVGDVEYVYIYPAAVKVCAPTSRFEGKECVADELYSPAAS